ncbi:MAG: TonB family protein [Bdellovibrionales bacterium]|nr:TonB family protein [Bdellovibrionales bacterium]
MIANAGTENLKSERPGLQSTEAFNFKPALVKSAVAHVAVALLLTVRAYIFPSEPLRIESAIRVDIVGLPEKSQALPPPIEEPAAEAPKPEVVPETTKELPPIEVAKPPTPKDPPVVLKPKKPDPKKQRKDQESALKRLQALAKLDQQARADAAQKALAAAKNAQAVVRGNQISKGNSLSGLTRLDHAKYLDELEARVKSQWRPPKFLASAKLRVRVVLIIDSNGSILKKSIVQSSGNSVFDESAIQAIEAAQPLKAPPETLQGLLSTQGVELDLEPSTFR